MMSSVETTAPELSIVIPVYNGAATVPRLVRALARCDIPGGVEVVLVNDGSADDSAAVCAALIDSEAIPVIFVDLARNFGEHNAVMTGLGYASGAWVVTMDDDLQNPAEDVEKLYRAARDNDLDAVFAGLEQRKQPAWRSLGSRFANFTARKIIGMPGDIRISSFRCLSRRLVDQLIRYNGPYPYIDGMIMTLTRHVANVPVVHGERGAGSSNYTLGRLVKLWSHILFNFSIQPLRISLIVACAFFVIAGLGMAYVLVDFVFGVYEAPGWASLMAIFLAFSGLQFLILGLIGEYVGRIYMSIIGLPQTSVRRVFRPGDRAADRPVTTDAGRAS
jgi:undecaprenyl-phosphate 4-deoxy-4-formamido-L-arabinose transferase